MYCFFAFNVNINLFKGRFVYIDDDLAEEKLFLRTITDRARTTCHASREPRVLCLTENARNNNLIN